MKSDRLLERFMRFIKRAGFLFLFLLLLLIAGFGQKIDIPSPLTDPGIGNGEHAVYRVKNKRGVFVIEDTVRISEDGRYYIIESHGRNTRKLLKLSRETMFPEQLDVFVDKTGYRIHSVKKLEYKKELKGNVIPIMSNFDSEYVLRGFPFVKPKTLVMDFMNESEGERSSNFEVSVHFAGKEDVDIGSRMIPCYVLEIKYKVTGIFFLFKSMFPQTKVWYSIQKPHYMVKYENKGGQGDTGDMTILITDYLGWK